VWEVEPLPETAKSEKARSNLSAYRFRAPSFR
jgi:hypothetical protein